MDLETRYLIRRMLDGATSASELIEDGEDRDAVERAVDVIEAHPAAASVRDIPEDAA